MDHRNHLSIVTKMLFIGGRGKHMHAWIGALWKPRFMKMESLRIRARVLCRLIFCCCGPADHKFQSNVSKIQHDRLAWEWCWRVVLCCSQYNVCEVRTRYVGSHTFHPIYRTWIQKHLMTVSQCMHGWRPNTATLILRHATLLHFSYQFFSPLSSFEYFAWIVFNSDASIAAPVLSNYFCSYFLFHFAFRSHCLVCSASMEVQSHCVHA